VLRIHGGLNENSLWNLFPVRISDTSSISLDNLSLSVVGTGQIRDEESEEECEDDEDDKTESVEVLVLSLGGITS
jgi:hypothetical protein